MPRTARKPEPPPSPDRYLSTNADPNGGGGRLWRVIGAGGMPECADSDLDDALVTFMLHDRAKTRQADIPVWDGDKGVFTTLGAYLAAVGGDNG